MSQKENPREITRRQANGLILGSMVAALGSSHFLLREAGFESGLGVVKGIAQHLFSEVSHNFSLEQSIEFCQKVESLYAAIDIPSVKVDSASLNQLAREIVPFFKSEGITSEAVFPLAAVAVPADSTLLNGAVGSACLSVDSSISYKKSLVVSKDQEEVTELTGSRAAQFIIDFIHELSHLQMHCQAPYGARISEAGQELFTMIVLAGMTASKATPYAESALLASLFEQAQETLLYHIIDTSGNVSNQDIIERYNSNSYVTSLLQDHLTPEQDRDKIKERRYRYGYLPYIYMLEGVKRGYIDAEVYIPSQQPVSMFKLKRYLEDNHLISATPISRVETFLRRRAKAVV